MAGVASPMFRRSRGDGARFTVGLAIAGVAAGAVVALPLYLAGTLLSAVLPGLALALLVAATGFVFGLLDLLNRTPHIWRQVPQRFVRTLKPGTLGMVWGFDLGLLFTTQKTTSLLWAAIVAVSLLTPGSVPIAVIAFSLCATLGILVWTMLAASRPRRPGAERRVWQGRIRVISGVLMMFASVATVLVQVLD